MQEEGLVKAAESMLPAWKSMQEAMAAAGIDPALVASITGPMTAIFDALADEGTQKIISGLEGATQAVKGLADAGYLTQGSFQGLEQVATSTYEQLIAGGMDSATALQMIAPSLAEIQKLHEQYGVTIDETTQKLMDQAAEAGVAFPTDPLQQVISLLKDIAEALGAIPRDIQTNVNVHYSQTGDVPDGTVHGGPPGGPKPTGIPDDGVPVPHGATGLVVPPSPGGSHVVLGEAGSTELAGPVDGLARAIGRGLAEGLAGVQLGGGDVYVAIGGDQLDAIITRRMKAGFIGG